MDTEYYLSLAPWLHGRINDYIDYLHNGGERKTVQQSGNWKTDKMRASETDSCPRYIGASKRGEVEKTFPPEKQWLFEIANRVADIVKEGVVWSAEQQNLINHGSIHWDSYTEARVDPDAKPIAGTVDALLVGRTGPDRRTSMYVPIEVKHTRADKHEGLTQRQVWQVINYMELYDSQGGLLVTVYDPYSSSGTHKVWPILRVEDGFQVFTPSGVPIKFVSSDWPTNDAGENFFSLEEFYRRASTMYHYLKYSPDTPPYEHPNYRCGEIVPVETYVRGYTFPSGKKYKAGDIKPGSGTIKFTCPLADLCWHHGHGTTDVWWEKF